MELSAQELETYTFVDPAGKPKGPGDGLKKGASRQAVVTVKADYLSRMFVASAWAGKLPTTAFLGKIISECKRWNPRLCGIEANAMQELFADLVIEKAKTELASVRMYPVFQPTKVKKEWRIRNVLEPVINEGRLFLLPGMSDLEAELRNFPLGDSMDMVDALASAISLVPRRISTIKEERSSEQEARLRYLRETGAPASYIEQVEESFKPHQTRTQETRPWQSRRMVGR